ncbi:MAG: Amylo-alpha6-glucosidase [Labilithrix sp.]|nr:Amylo-alpha6-glucosidase [Labilithrix sp.]
MTAGTPAHADDATPELTSAGDVETLVRANGSRFVVTNRVGDIAPNGARELGLFVDDTRFLSFYELRVEGETLIHLSCDSYDPAVNQIDLMVSTEAKLLEDPQNFLHVERRQILEDAFREEISFVNYLEERVDITVSFSFAADFVDIFEVRGQKRSRRGSKLEPSLGADSVELGYRGVDGEVYTTRIHVAPKPEHITASHVTVKLALEPDESRVVEFQAVPSVTRRRPFDPKTTGFDADVAAARRRAERFSEESTRFHCDNAIVQHIVQQSSTDLRSLGVEVAGHRIVAAGVPWFCCPFGRDSLIAAYEALLLNPELASSSLRALAAFQGRKFDDFTEEEPGKILHELRFGEMAACKEIPHLPYYGSIDATPLFVIVLDATYRVTADHALLRELAPALRAALGWIDRRSENATRLVTYLRKGPKGIWNQGWKDSLAGVSFPDGRRAEPPIALCEVQGYCVDAYARGTRLLRALGDAEGVRTYEARAKAMADLVEHAFWLPDAKRYGFAIDASGTVLPTVVSNLGHLLWSRVPTPERARTTADLLVSPDSLSAFGVRTLAAGQPVYNPLSYHNGTVWPHDNAILAKGMANYGLMEHASVLFEAMARSMTYFRDRRLPELFCGVSRNQGTLVRYPVACSPQAWAAAAPFLLLQAVLGIHIDGTRQRLWIRNPHMPPSMSWIDIERLRVGASWITLRIRRVGKRCHVDRLDVTGAPLRTEIVLE